MTQRMTRDQSTGPVAAPPQKANEGHEGKYRPKEDDLSKRDDISEGFDADTHRGERQRRQDSKQDTKAFVHYRKRSNSHRSGLSGQRGTSAIGPVLRRSVPVEPDRKIIQPVIVP